MKKTKKNTKKESKAPALSLRVDDFDLEQLQIKAQRYANGNLSAWLRYAGIMYIPKKGARVSRKAA